MLTILQYKGKRFFLIKVYKISPSPQRPCKRMAIKLTVYMAPMFEIIREQMPSLKMFFNTRHPKKSMVSYFRTFQVN